MGAALRQRQRMKTPECDREAARLLAIQMGGGKGAKKLERAFVIKKRQLEVECDFTASETVIYARADVTITLGRLLAVVVTYAIRLLRQYLKIQKSRKDGKQS